ncbi:hypothetical protein FACS189493_7840 [Spirochaetia bacterium]|nr:hypothetical protein FACS189493_7840 [Spirochaetia bacterium]
MYSGGYGVKNVLADLEKIVDLCERNNIRLIIFTNPLHELTYQYAVENGYLDFLNGLSAITKYYNFSGINDVTTNNQYYLETSHYKVSVGDLIINTIFDNIIDEKLLSQGFGYYVTVDSKDKLLDILREQLQPSR